MSNASLDVAKKARNDEFYTAEQDVKDEVENYKGKFAGKTVYCNCDDPEQSNFWKYFHEFFEELGLKKLISTHYEKDGQTYKMEYAGGNDGDISFGTKTPLKGNGAFESAECEEILDECDMVVSNPPFSRFRPYLAQIMEHGKEFLILGSLSAITYKTVFPHFKNGEIWLGCCNGDKIYRVPDDAEGKKVFTGEDGKKYQKFGNTCWFTNLDHEKRHRELELDRECTYYGHEDEYPRFDNYNAIDVGRVSRIPCDYYDVIDVPVTFFNSHCMEQFEIIGATESEDKGFSNGLWDQESKTAQPLIDGKKKYKRLFIRRKDDGIMGVPVSYMTRHCPEQFEILGVTKGVEAPDKRANPFKNYLNVMQHNADGTKKRHIICDATLKLGNPPANQIYYTADNVPYPLKCCYPHILIRFKNEYLMEQIEKKKRKKE